MMVRFFILLFVYFFFQCSPFGLVIYSLLFPYYVAVFILRLFLLSVLTMTHTTSSRFVGERIVVFSSTNTADPSFKCPHCKRVVGTAKFAPHLEKCMGKGRGARSSRRRATNSYAALANGEVEHSSKHTSY